MTEEGDRSRFPSIAWRSTGGCAQDGVVDVVVVVAEDVQEVEVWRERGGGAEARDVMIPVAPNELMAANQSGMACHLQIPGDVPW